MLKTSSVPSGKYHRVFVFGMKSSGKSSLLEQVIFGKRPACDSLLTSPSPSVAMASSVPLSSSSSLHNVNHNHRLNSSNNNAIHNNGTSCHYNSINSLQAQLQPAQHAPGHHHHHHHQLPVHHQPPNVSSINASVVASPFDAGTIEDVYSASISNEDRGGRERIHFYEVPDIPLTSSPEIIKNNIHYADGFVLVYSINSGESFALVKSLKKSIDKYREKRDIPIIVLGNKLDRFRERKLNTEECGEWAAKEKVHLIEVTATERSKSLIELFSLLASRLNPSSQSKLDRLSKLSVKRTTSLTMEL